MDEGRLLREYIENKSQKAFAELTERYLRLVYGTCLRELRDPGLSEDATQVVFVVLSQKAKSLQAAALPSWLFTTARYTARNILVQERGRKRREQQAMEQNISEDRNNASWDLVSGELNAAVAALGRADREIILRRYFEGMTFKEAGEALGISENTARMRSARAVEKLRRRLSKAGVAISAAGLAMLLDENAAHAVPNISGWTITERALQAASPHLQSISQGVIHAMLMSKVKAAAIVAAAILIAGVGIYVAAAQRPGNGSDPKALAILEKSAQAYYQLHSFSETITETSAGVPAQQFSVTAHIAVQRPNQVAVLIFSPNTPGDNSDVVVNGTDIHVASPRFTNPNFMPRNIGLGDNAILVANQTGQIEYTSLDFMAQGEKSDAFQKISQFRWSMAPPAVIDGAPVVVIRGVRDYGQTRFIESGVPKMVHQSAEMTLYIGAGDYLIHRELVTNHISDLPDGTTLLEHTDINTAPHFTPGTFDQAAGPG